LTEKSASKDISRQRVPPPAHPRERRQPLPECEPKPPHEDATAPERLRAILQSPSYRTADQDVTFLKGAETRGPRLQLDYLKAETLLERHGIRHTIVVFGGTRIAEPLAAQRQLDALREDLAARPNDDDLKRRVATTERVLEKSKYYEVARDFSRLVGSATALHDRRLAVVTGGGPGIMEASNRGAYDVGALSIGFNITLPQEQFPNPYVTPELCFQFHYFALRKLHFLLRARALVAFPGGFGTFDELFETLTLVQTRKIEPLPIILVGESYWRRAFDPAFLEAEGTIDPEDRDLFWYAETADEIWSDIQTWYDRAGRPFLP